MLHHRPGLYAGTRSQQGNGSSEAVIEQSTQPTQQRYAGGQEPAEEPEDLDLAHIGLPVAFQRRIDRFRAANPTFRDFERYEMNCCTQALLIAETLGSEDAVERFFQTPSWQEQKAMVPGLDSGHSGHSFAVSCRLAATYLRAPYMVEHEHGALAALVGCDAYGCRHPSAQQGTRSAEQMANSQ
jgi:hypothetical protein